MEPRVIQLLATVFVSLVLGPLAPATSLAQTGPAPGSFSVMPSPDADVEQPRNPAREPVPASRSWFTFRAQPGQAIRDSLRIVNTGATPLDLLVYPVDATTGATTGLVMLNRDAPRSAVATWVQVSAVSQPTLHLAAGAIADVEFTVTVPPSAGAGEFWGGLMVEDTFVRKGTGQFSVDQVFRSGVALGLTLPGERVERLAVRGISAKVVNDLNQVFVIDLANEGNVLVKSRGALELRDATGALVGRHELTLDNVLPGTSVPYELFWPKESLPAGKYQASVSLTYSPTAAPATASVRDLAIETPGLRIAPAVPGLAVAGAGAAQALDVVPRSVAPASLPGGSAAQSLLFALLGAAATGVALLAHRLITHPLKERPR